MKELSLFAAVLALACSPPLVHAGLKSFPALSPDGQPLNLGFEDGTLRDWDAVGSAFENQPVRGDTVNRRYKDQRSNHDGEYWIGTYELAGDHPQGTLTSVPFKVAHPFCSFLLGGGSHADTRVELVMVENKKVFFKTSAFSAEPMRPVVVDLTAVQGKNIFIRLVDENSGGWGHINFDHFVFYDERIGFPNEFDPTAKSPANNRSELSKDLSDRMFNPAIRQHFENLGGTNCFFLRALLGQEVATPDGLGRFCRFEGGGSIYWTTNYGAWSIHGLIRERWLSMNAEASVLGYPVTDEKSTADGKGRFNHFKNPRLGDQQGSMYYTPALGAHEIHGPIRDKWMSLGAEKSSLGYPTSDQYVMDDGTGALRNNFQHGTITYNVSSGVVTIP